MFSFMTSEILSNRLGTPCPVKTVTPEHADKIYNLCPITKPLKMHSLYFMRRYCDKPQIQRLCKFCVSEHWILALFRGKWEVNIRYFSVMVLPLVFSSHLSSNNFHMGLITTRKSCNVFMSIGNDHFDLIQEIFYARASIQSASEWQAKQVWHAIASFILLCAFYNQNHILKHQQWQSDLFDNISLHINPNLSLKLQYAFIKMCFNWGKGQIWSSPLIQIKSIYWLQGKRFEVMILHPWVT